MDFKYKICMLDAALTRKDWRTVQHTFSNSSIKIPLHFIIGTKRAYYLSDGGYSRICCTENGEFFLANVSIDPARANWVNCKELIADIEALIKEAIQEWIEDGGH